MTEITHTFDFTVPAAPEHVFPLLCPVLEYKWIPYWRCELLHLGRATHVELFFSSGATEVAPYERCTSGCT
jgi:hypothetical protein